MSQSAYAGTPPVTSDDKLIAAAFKIISPSLYNVDPAYPLGIPKPSPDAPNDYNGSNILRLSVTCMVFVILITGGRLSIRKFQKKLSFGPDDWLVIPAALAAIAYYSGELVLIRGGCIGHHVYYCTYENYNKATEIITLIQSIFYFGVYCAKISIVLFNQRLTALTSRKWAITHWIYFAVILSCGIVSLFSNIFTCTPVRAHYNLINLTLAAEDHSVHCIDQNRLQVALRALHIGTDLALLAIPLLVLRKLKLPLRKKIQMGFLFSIGVMTCVASIMRNVVVERFSSPDLPFNLFPVLVWDTIDITFATIVASLPVYAAILDRIVTRILNIVSETSQNPGSKLKSGGKKVLYPLQYFHSSRLSSHVSRGERLDDSNYDSTHTDTKIISDRERDGGIYRTDEFELRSIVSGPLPDEQNPVAKPQDSLQLPP